MSSEADREWCRTRTKVLVVIAAVGYAASACLGTQVGVLPSGPGIVAAPKPRGCKVEFVRTKVDRPYDEIAAMHAWGGATPERLQRALGEKACGLGADAVIVTQDYQQRDGTMNAVAIKYRVPGDDSGQNVNPSPTP